VKQPGRAPIPIRRSIRSRASSRGCSTSPLVSLVDDREQFFAGATGLPRELAECRSTPLSQSFCQHVVATREVLRIADTRRHPTLHHHPAIEALGIAAYLGVPITTSDGYTLGSLAAWSHSAREWTDDDVQLLRDLATSVSTELEQTSTAGALRSAASTPFPTQTAAYVPSLKRWFEVRTVPVRHGMSVYFHDIIEQRDAESALAQRETQLRHAQKMEASARWPVASPMSSTICSPSSGRTPSCCAPSRRWWRPVAPNSMTSSAPRPRRRD